MYLGPTSSHAPSTHVSWPAGLADRARRLCNSREAVNRELDLLKSFLSKWYAEPDIRMLLEGRNAQKFSRSSSRHRYGITARLILPFHLSLSFGNFGSRIRGCYCRYSGMIRRILGCEIDIGVGFKLGCIHLQHKLQNFNKFCHTKAEWFGLFKDRTVP